MSAIRVLESSGSSGALQLADGSGGFTSSNAINFNTSTSQFFLSSSNGSAQHVLSGAVHFPTAISGSLTNLTDGTSYIVAGSNVTVTTGSSGQITIASSGGGGAGSITAVSGSTSIGSVSTIAASDGFVLVNEGSNRVALTASIGNPGDGDYTDGLFTDFEPTTRLGVAIDRINEVLKALEETIKKSDKRKLVELLALSKSARDRWMV